MRAVLYTPTNSGQTVSYISSLKVAYFFFRQQSLIA